MAPSVLSCDLSRTTVCERYQPLVRKTIRGLKVPTSLYEDAEQEGMIGLLQAFDHYDATSPVQFGAFARNYVKGAIIRGVFPKANEAVLTPVGDGFDLQDVQTTEPWDNVNETIEVIELRDWLDSLAPKDGWLIWRLYWQGATTAEIATELDSTVHWVNERHRILIGRAQSVLGAV